MACERPPCKLNTKNRETVENQNYTLQIDFYYVEKMSHNCADKLQDQDFQLISRQIQILCEIEATIELIVQISKQPLTIESRQELQFHIKQLNRLKLNLLLLKV